MDLGSKISTNTAKEPPTDENDMESKAEDDTHKAETSNTVHSTCQFYLKGQCRFGERCRNSHMGVDEALLPISKSKLKKEINTESKGKKAPMKTAVDVISRIQWDTNLPTECFSIGYLDRFLGIIEKPFSAFCWEDLASVGHDVLAIPKHRIQYFKYQDLIVWDKSTRTDNVFGSTGSGKTILDIIDNYETLLETEAITHSEDNTTCEDTEELIFMEEENANECSNFEENTKLRPTHFIAVHIRNEDVRNSVRQIQNILLENNPDIAEFCTPVETLHLTLCLLHLDTPQDIQTALTALHELKCEIQRILPPSLILTFEGLKDFYSRVLYLAPSSIPEIEKFAHTLDQSFRSKGLTLINSPDPNSFHITIAKIPKRILRKNPSLQFSKEVYENAQVTLFGSHHVDSLSFCYAGSSRRTDGFYTTLMELPLY